MFKRNTKTIMIIDDEPDIMLMMMMRLKTILEENGFKVDSFNDLISELTML
jgi:DNA-binding NtrC family response regulator